VISDEELQGRMSLLLSTVAQIRRGDMRTVFLNMDQTAVYYNSNHVTTVDFVRAKAIQVAVNDCKSKRVTAALTVASNGAKLRPFVVFKGRPGGRINRELAHAEELNRGTI
jgi:hypothetical protein